jgi:serine/threonine-protein kinase
VLLGPGKRDKQTEDDPAPAEQPANVAANEPPPPEPTEPPPEPTLAPADETETGAPAADETETGELEAEDETEGDDDGPVLVPVEFVANEFFFVYVRVKGRKLTLEPRARAQLPVGSHTVYLRQSKDEKWQRAGRIKIEADQQYRVLMQKPAGLKLVTK